jgi:hypothetical protein
MTQQHEFFLSGIFFVWWDPLLILVAAALSKSMVIGEYESVTLSWSLRLTDGDSGFDLSGHHNEGFLYVFAVLS